ncbi:MAG: class I SAM-dependent methyltransferase [Candidatus Odinarchaeota archaeon]
MPKRIFDLVGPVYDKIITGRPPASLVDLLELSGRERVLEVGGGTGRTARAIIDHCQELWLLDPSVPMIKKVQQKLPTAKLVLGYVERMPFRDGMFDTVFAVDSLHHWDDHARGLKEIKRVLKTSGLFMVVEFDPKTRTGYLIELMEKIFRMGSTFYSPEQMRKLLHLSGLKTVKQEYMDQGTYVTVATKV